MKKYSNHTYIINFANDRTIYKWKRLQLISTPFLKIKLKIMHTDADCLAEIQNCIIVSASRIESFLWIRDENVLI